MKKYILILTNSADGEHTESVVTKLRERGQHIFRLDVDRLAAGEIKIYFRANDNAFTFELYSGNEVISSSDVKSVWYRRPNFFNLQIKDVVQKRYAEDEISNFLEGLWLTLTGVFWLNNPRNLESARRKIYQLKLAKEIGFQIPRTIVTNDVTEVREFFSTCNDKIIFKAFYRELLDYGEKKYGIPTTLITPRHLQRIETVRQLPCLFQEFIDKAYELRVTVVGDKLFPVRIDTSKTPQTIVDWRNPQFINSLDYALIDLPDNIKNLCLTMLEKLGLSFGAFDLVVSKDGQYFFLEVNPNGQWYWLEALMKILISDAIADILSDERG
jgi:glutathione synthase/RimK-type ligase-like ATP-grasp enzyme